MSSDHPPSSPVLWLVYPRECATVAARLERGVRVEAQHAQDAWNEGARRLGTLRDELDVQRLDRLIPAAA
jgi:hypothetical protein